MSNLVVLDNVSHAFGFALLLDHAKLQITAGERVCLIGRNGCGKSTLLKIIDGTLEPDSGTVWRKPYLRLARLEQELPQTISGSVREFVAEGLAEAAQLLNSYHELLANLSKQKPSQNDLVRLEELQSAIECCHGWDLEQNIANILSQLALDGEQLMVELSGGWQRRAALAKALVGSPELLLLDEPTNHLDIETIQWLEEQLLAFNLGLLFVTHDRSLLQRLATRILELDRGQLTSWPGDYGNFLRRKDELLHAEQQQNQLFDKTLAKEEAWIRQGIKARRTRNEGRVRALKKLRVERSQRRELESKPTFNINEVVKSGRLVIEGKHLSHNFGAKQIINDFSIRIMRGDRIGLIGPNGAGKSTLINILLGKLPPKHGEVTLGTNLEVAYFDQLRNTLDPEKTVLDNVAHGSTFVDCNGKQRHIISYLSDFLFTPQRALSLVKALSGGECNRLLLACLFSKPANVLVLDEPTNDLDLETLELLEELLTQYQGTILLVSHDRAFLDNIVTSTLAFEGEGKVVEYVGGYTDWLRQSKATADAGIAISKKKEEKTIDQKIVPENARKKLSYHQQRELDLLPKQIEEMEKEKMELEKKIADPSFYKQDSAQIKQRLAELKIHETRLECAYQLWEELEAAKLL